MSKKQLSRMNKLKVKAVWPRVIELVAQSIVVLFLTGMSFFFAFIGIIGTIITDNNYDSFNTLKIVNSNWNSNEKDKLAKELAELQSKSNQIGSICIIDENQNILATFGENTPDMNELIFDFERIKKLEKKGMFRSSITGEALNEDGTDVFKRFPNGANLVDFISDTNGLIWGSEKVIHINQWVVFKSDIPGINVCIENRYEINRFQSRLAMVMGIFFVASILFFCLYSLINILMFVSECKTVNDLVTTDAVTGGYNKEYFIVHSKRFLKKRKIKPSAVVVLRMEKYNNYCTAYGTREGEAFLAQMDLKLSNMLDKKEKVAHYGNADFVLLLLGETDEEINLRISKMFLALNKIREKQHTTFSAGVCRVQSHQDDILNLMTSASLAIPRNQNNSEKIGWFNDSMKEEQIWERRIEDDMERALDAKEFQVYLQPKYSTKAEILSAAEALVRWIHPVLGFISPGRFIPIFERNGFILKLDDYMITEVCRLQARWLEEGKTLVPISVNVSRAHFTTDNLAEHICGIVDEFNVPHEFIELELTESAFFDDKAVLLNTVKKLKALGFKVSMDDFGAGYSSLNSLKELPLDVIKLDAEFFRGSEDDIERSNLIVGDTITLAKKLGMQIVAEGIETREQVDFLAKQDCDLIQGFYFAKPLPVSDFEKSAWGK